MSAARPSTTLAKLTIFTRVRERKDGTLQVEYKDSDQVSYRFNTLRKKLGLKETSLFQDPIPGRGQHISGPGWSWYIAESDLDKAALKTMFAGIKQKKTDDEIIADLNKIKDFPKFIEAEKEKERFRPGSVSP